MQKITKQRDLLTFTTPDGFQRVYAGWCNGNVGMTGTSYNGTLCLSAATTGVEGLKAIARRGAGIG